MLLAMYARVNFPKFAKVLESYVKNRGKEAVIAAAFTFSLTDTFWKISASTCLCLRGWKAFMKMEAIWI